MIRYAFVCRPVRAGTPRVGLEIDDRVLPAEAGLTERAVSFTKGCYPGQEPIARLHYRGHANRGLRVLRLDTDEPPVYDAELVLDGKVPQGELILALQHQRLHGSISSRFARWVVCHRRIIGPVEYCLPAATIQKPQGNSARRQ